MALTIGETTVIIEEAIVTVKATAGEGPKDLMTVTQGQLRVVTTTDRIRAWITLAVLMTPTGILGHNLLYTLRITALKVIRY